MEGKMLDDARAIDLVIRNLKTVKKILTDLNWDSPNAQKEGAMALNAEARRIVFEMLQYLDLRRRVRESEERLAEMIHEEP